MRIELVDGNTDVLNIMLNDGWKIVNTFPNPYPEPYFFALMSLEHPNENDYDVSAVGDIIHKRTTYPPNRWSKSENDAAREQWIADNSNS